MIPAPGDGRQRKMVISHQSHATPAHLKTSGARNLSLPSGPRRFKGRAPALMLSTSATHGAWSEIVVALYEVLHNARGNAPLRWPSR